MIDLHTHILPGLDDGPGHLSESLQIVALLSDLGFDHIFLTPHFRQGFFEVPAETVKEACQRLRGAVEDRHPAVRLTEAHEVHLGSVFDSRGKVRGFLRFGAGGGRMLLELPRRPFAFELLFRTIDQLLHEGIRVVLAHPEKASELSQAPQRYRALCERGVMLQLNVTSLAGSAGRHAQRAAEELCGEGLVHAVGTDSHRMAHAARFVAKGMRRAHTLLGEKRLKAAAEGAGLCLDDPGEIRAWN